MEIRSLTLEDFTSRLQSKEPFVFLRFGDGEWNAVLGKSNCNCDGQKYEDVRNYLRHVLLNAPASYWMGMQPFAMRLRGPEIEAWLAENRPRGLDWVWSETLPRASMRNRLPEFFKSLAGRQVVLIGPKYLSSIGKQFRVHKHLFVPTNGKAQTAFHRIVADAKDFLKQRADDATFLVSAGMTSEGLIHEIAKKAPKATFIDTGSLFEPYVGKSIRRYHQSIVERESNGRPDSDHPNS